MKKQQPTPKSVNQTTSLIFDLENSDFEKLRKSIYIVKHQILESLISPSSYNENGEPYKKLHNKYRKNSNFPFYVHTGSKSVYVGYPNESSVKPFEEEKIDHNVDFTKQELVRCWLNVLCADFFERETHHIQNKDFYLHIKKHRDRYETVLKLNFRHHYQESNSKYCEFFIEDRAIRLENVGLDYKGKEIPYTMTIDKAGSFVAFKQVNNKANREDNAPIFIENTSKNDRQQVKFHSIESVEEYENSRNDKLTTFIDSFSKYLNERGIKVVSKKLYLEQVHTKIQNNSLFENTDFNVTVFDERFNKTDSVDTIIQKLNATDYGVTFSLGSKYNSSTDDNILIMMDYSTGDCEKNGVLKSKVEKDSYKIVKKAGFKVSQGFCINMNTFIADYKKREMNEEDFLEYKYLEKSGEFEKQIKLNLEICLQQLLLKGFVSRNVNIDKLPYSNLLKDICFLSFFTENSKRYINIAQIENSVFKFETYIDKDLSDSLDETLKKFGKSIDEIINLRQSYDEHRKIDKNEIHIILSKDFVWEVKELSERVLYPKELKTVLENRDDRKEVEYFLLKKENEKFTKNQIEEYNNYILKNYEDKISFEQLSATEKKKKKEQESIEYQKYQMQNLEGKLTKILFLKDQKTNRIIKNNLFHILNIEKETIWRDSLGYKGTKGKEYLNIYQGIWFDRKKSQYIVGQKESYKDYSQQKGFQVRKICILEGDFNKDLFFSLLNVDFIKNKSFTVLPYVFRMMKMNANMLK